jgi:hypothetical protein
MPKDGIAKILAGWDRLLAGAADVPDDLPWFKLFRAQLGAERAAVQAAQARKRALRAESVQATKELHVVVARGRDLAARLRAVVIARYGSKSNKLREFGMKPAGRPRTAARGKPVSPVRQTGAPRNPTAP